MKFKKTILFLTIFFWLLNISFAIDINNTDVVHSATITAPWITTIWWQTLNRLTDDITSISWNNDYAFHPTNALNKKVIFTFSSKEVLAKFKIYNRTACCNTRIINSQIILYLDDVEVERKTIISSSSIINMDFIFDVDNAYNKIELLFSGNAQNLREIEIFNYDYIFPIPPVPPNNDEWFLSQTFNDLNLTSFNYEEKYYTGSWIINYSKQFNDWLKMIYEIKIIFMVFVFFFLFWIFYTFLNDLLWKN